jgi:tetratricopeptide (TPR) repeat protein
MLGTQILSISPRLVPMARTGRNDPCPCGSGKKYKRCCLEEHQAAEHEALAAAAAGPEPQALPIPSSAVFEGDEYFGDDEADELATASNAVLDLIQAGRFDDAEKAAQDLLERFPDVHDGYDRLAMVYEASGDTEKAAYYYQQAIDFIRTHPELYDPGFENLFVRALDRLKTPGR